ncbi:LCP family protein [Streptomyces sp. NPDC056716]|uniref:LCP family protein n=1 Tax=unclassified Streptomyces TaxID=2593676 RepID=UPI00368786F1
MTADDEHGDAGENAGDNAGENAGGAATGSTGRAATGPGRRGRGVLKVLGIAVAGAVVLGVAAGGWVYWKLNDNITSVDINSALGDNRPEKPAITPSPGAEAASAPLPSQAMNILVLGSDSRSGAENQRLGGGDTSGARSDTAMVFHIDAGGESGTVVSIPRDTLVTRPSCPLPDGGETEEQHGVMFNTAYSVGGPVCAVKTVESFTGVRMDHYLEIDFAGFAALIDAVGGVTVTVDQDIEDEQSHLTLEAGTHLLDGEQALGLARTRYSLPGGSDLARIELQQRLVKALLTQIADTSLLTDPAKLYDVATTVTGSLTTDTGLDSLGELVGLGESLRALSPDAVETLTLPVVRAPSDPNRVVADEPEAGELWESLR